MHSSLCKRRLHPDEEGSLQSVIRSQKTGAAGLHWETKTQKHTNMKTFRRVFNFYNMYRNVEGSRCIFHWFSSSWQKTIWHFINTQIPKDGLREVKNKELIGMILICVKQINTFIVSAAPLGQSQPPSKCQSSRGNQTVKCQNTSGAETRGKQDKQDVQAQIKRCVKEKYSTRLKAVIFLGHACHNKSWSILEGIIKIETKQSLRLLL